MSYKKEERRILAGSLNLLPPTDQIADTDGLEMTNWRVDQLGALRSRQGLIPFLNFADPINSIGRRGEQYYFGGGANLYRSGTSGPIATGFDGNPIWFASMQGYTWIMNRSLQGKDDGFTFSLWGLYGPSKDPSSAPVAAAGGSGNLTGTYTWLVTFATANSLESGPGAASQPLTLNSQSASLSNIPISSDPQFTQRWIYRSGGTLGQAYRVGIIPDNTTTTFTDNMSDAAATTAGFILDLTHDPPPSASGVVGPYFNRLIAFSSADHPNRIWWTKPGQASYFPGSGIATGQWADVGDDGEAILAMTVHARVAVVYKERSIWRLIGDPDNGYLEKTNSNIGIIGPKAVANAGAVDYFASAEGIYKFDLDRETKMSWKLDPIFLGRPVTLTPGYAIWPLRQANRASACMEYAYGRLYFSYTEDAGGTNQPTATLVYHVDSDRWYMYRFNLNQGGFTALFYQGSGLDLWGAGADGSVNILRYGTTDLGQPINLAYQSRYETQGFPDNDKVYIDLVLDYETGGDNATVQAAYNSAASISTLGSISSASRTRSAFSLGNTLARNISIRIECGATHEVVVYGIYLYYYVEARTALSVATLPFDFGTGKVKQVKELQIDADARNGAVTATLSSDLPGDVLAAKVTLTLNQSTTRRIFQLPFATVEGRIWQLALSSGNPFRLYAARALLRVVGVYIEAYEAGAGYVWDSMEQDFVAGVAHVQRGVSATLHGNPIKRARALELEIDSPSAINVALMSDLPGNQVQTRYSASVGTGSAGRRIFRLPMNASNVEGRLFRLQLSGNAQYKLYGARIEILPVGVYIEAYEAQGGAVYDSRELDFGMDKIKEARKLEVDIHTDGPVTLQLFTDMPGQTMAQRISATIDSAVGGTGGRRKIYQIMAPPLEGRFWRLVLTGQNTFRLYGARLKWRKFGHYLDANEAAGGAIYDSTELDFGTQQVKQFRMIEAELQTYGPILLHFLTDLAGNQMTERFAQTIDTSAQIGRRKLQIPLLPSVLSQDKFETSNNLLYGRLARVYIGASAAYKLFNLRVQWRPVGTFVEAYEAQGGATWDSTPINLGAPQDKIFDQVRFEMDSDGPVTMTVYTDLPGETLTQRYTLQVSTAGFGRRFVIVPLNANTEGRLIRIVLSSSQAFRLYQGQVYARTIGRYIAASANDAFRTLEYDFESERVKLFKKLEVDINTDGPVNLTLYTDSPGGLAPRFTKTINTSSVRTTVKVPLPANIRGRIARVEIGGQSSARLYKLRAWVKKVGEPVTTPWEWMDFPLEQSPVLQQWFDLPVAPTPPDWQWAELPVEKTEPVWQWTEFPVMPTPPQWVWADFPVVPTPDTWEWLDIPVEVTA